MGCYTARIISHAFPWLWSYSYFEPDAAPRHTYLLCHLPKLWFLQVCLLREQWLESTKNWVIRANLKEWPIAFHFQTCSSVSGVSDSALFAVIPVAFEDQYKLHPYTRERDTRRSSSVPPKISSPKEPVWFSMAKKKAQAWSQMSDIMQ